MREYKTPYALMDGSIVQIQDVERGLSCECYCVVCGEKLIAKKGGKNAHHFAHYNGLGCEKSIETALHLAAKDILSQATYIQIPKIEIQLGKTGEHFNQLSPIQKFYFDKVFLENKFDAIIPDVILERNGAQLLIEIAVTHFIDQSKKDKIISMDISTIEINLSKWNLQFSLEDLREVLLNGLEEKTWVFNSQINQVENNLKKQIVKKVISNLGLADFVEDCPLEIIDKPQSDYAMLEEHCQHCKYFYGRDVQEGFEFVNCGFKALSHYKFNK